MTEDQSSMQPTEDPNLCANNGEEVSPAPPALADQKQVVQPAMNLPALASLKNEPDGPLVAAQLVGSVHIPKGMDPAHAQLIENSVIALYAGLKPQDGYEAILSRLLVGISNASMECLGRGAALPKDSPKARDILMRHAIRGGLAAADLVKAIDNHRGQRQQKVTVGEVNVHSGGQAIVGNVPPPTQREQAAEPLTTNRPTRRQRKTTKTRGSNAT